MPRPCLLLLLLLAPGALRAQEDEPEPELLSSAELQKLVAPIALYPDVLIAQILPASTEPLQIVQAVRYLKEQGGTVEELPTDKDWESSIVVLLKLPAVLNMLNDRLDWTEKLGDAVISQQKDVLAAIQVIRQAAHEAGLLESNDKQTIVVEKEVVKIVQADPEVVYVPSYDPQIIVIREEKTVVVKEEKDDDRAKVAVAFLAGVVVGALIADDHCHWYGGYVVVRHPWHPRARRGRWHASRHARARHRHRHARRRARTPGVRPPAGKRPGARPGARPGTKQPRARSSHKGAFNRSSGKQARNHSKRGSRSRGRSRGGGRRGGGRRR